MNNCTTCGEPTDATVNGTPECLTCQIERAVAEQRQPTGLTLRILEWAPVIIVVALVVIAIAWMVKW
jgi:hypothetical protein